MRLSSHKNSFFAKGASQENLQAMHAFKACVEGLKDFGSNRADFAPEALQQHALAA